MSELNGLHGSEPIAVSDRKAHRNVWPSLLAEGLPAVVAHEIRNPLSAMTHAMSLLCSSPSVHSEERELMELILEEGRRLHRLVDRAVAPGARSTAKLPHDRIGELIHQVLSLVKLEPGMSPDVVLQARLAGELPSPSLDRDGIRQVLWNLLLNAVQAVGASGEITVSAGSKKHDGAPGLAVEVRDDGPGIPPWIRRRVLSTSSAGDGKGIEPLSSSKRDGCGLGLAVAREMVEAHGGKLDIDDSYGGGACVRFWLPLNGPGIEL